MTSLVRGTAGALARLLMVLLTLGTSVPIATHGDAGHDPCESVAVPSTTEDARLQANGAAAGARHCEVCHWLRSLRALDVAFAAPATTIEGGWLISTLDVSRLSRLHVPAAPSRAPPA